MKKPTYPLEQVLTVKRDRVEKAEKVVEEKKKLLKLEEEKLEKIQKEHDQVLDHYNSKLFQLREALDTGTTSDEVMHMKDYLKLVKENLVKEVERLNEQKEHVKLANQHLEEAVEVLYQKRLEEEKIKLHKEHWIKEMKKEVAKSEAIAQDEIGQVLYEAHRQKKRSPKQ